jgi:hypothetical protein
MAVCPLLRVWQIGLPVDVFLTEVADAPPALINALCRRTDESWREDWPAGAPLADVVIRATRPNPCDRYPTVRTFTDAWRGAAGSDGLSGGG